MFGLINSIISYFVQNVQPQDIPECIGMKKQYDLVCKSISSTEWSMTNSIHQSNRRYIFWIEDDDRCPQMQIEFCDKCGNYVREHMPGKASKQVMCNCVNKRAVNLKS